LLFELQAAWVAGQYAHITFSDQNNFRKALQCVVSRMQDSELPVRVDSVFALRSFIEACKGGFYSFVSIVIVLNTVFSIQ
jgi:hypothetical protein